MKKLFTLGALFLTGGVLVAQQHVDTETKYTEKLAKYFELKENKIPQDQMEKKLALWKKMAQNSKAKGADIQGIANFSDIVANHPDANLQGGALEIWPDSTVQIEFDASTIDIFNHGMGAIYDPVFNNVDGWASVDLNFSIDDEVFVDTIYMDGFYFMNQEADDTLKFHVVTGAMQASAAGPFSGVVYNPDQFKNIPAGASAELLTMSYLGDPAHGEVGGLTATDVQTFSYPLTKADSGDVILKVPTTGLKLDAGQGMGVLVTYHPEPGTWNAGDLISLPNRTGPNLWRTVIIQNSAGVDDESYWLEWYLDTETNSNNYVFNETRYNSHTGADLWRNDQTTARSLLGNAIFFYVRGNSSSTVGIEENNAANIALTDNYPNPFNGTTKIGYGIEQASNVSFEVTDITGKVVVSQNEGRKQAGKYVIEIDAAQFNSGIYYYSIITENGKATKKMIILE